MNYNDLPAKFSINMVPVRNADAVLNSLTNIIATPIGSVPGHPEFGCGMDKYLFELIDPLIAQLIEEEIRYAVLRWEPRVKIIKIDVTDDPDYNRILINIYFSIKSDPENLERKYIYKVDV